MKGLYWLKLLIVSFVSAFLHFLSLLKKATVVAETFETIRIFSQYKPFNSSFIKWFTLARCKNPLEKTRNIQEMRRFWKLAIVKVLNSLFKIVTLGQKLKFKKASKNLFYKWFKVVLCKKLLKKKLKNPKNETILKIDHHAKPTAFTKSSLWAKN